MDPSSVAGTNENAERGSGSKETEAFAAYTLFSPEERKALTEALDAALPTAGPAFGAATRDLMTKAREPNPYELMSAMTFYLGSAEEGTNPEFNRPLDIYQHHLELAQAVLFRAGDPATVARPPGSYVDDLSSAIKAYVWAWTLLQVQKIQRAQTDEDRHREILLFQLRNHAATNRGWGYASRMERMLHLLLEPLADLRHELGFAPADLPAWWRAIMKLGNDRAQQHLADVRDAFDWPVDELWAKRLLERFGHRHGLESASVARAARDSEELRRHIITSHSDFRLHEIYRYTLDDLIRIWPGEVAAELVRSIVSTWAISPGDDCGVAADRLRTENPVVRRPFVSAGSDVWYLFCGWLPLHNPFDLIERTLEGREDATASYRDRRTEFLEQRVSELLTEALPGATVERALVSVDPTDGKEYENDVLALVSSFAVIAEAKAGGVHPDARTRPGVLRDRIKALVVDPSEQALRLAAQIEGATGDVEFRRRSDRSSVVVDANQVRRTLTLGVTLEPIADLLPRLSEVATAGFSAAAADALSCNINILDLEVVVDLLDHPSEVLHYLGRRSEIERHSFLGGDEVDLLGLYLQTGFNLGEHEFTGNYRLEVTGMSDPIDVWQYRLEAGMPAQKPRVQRTAWWERVLTRVEHRQPTRWAELGVTLCNVAPQEQQEFEGALRELRRSIVAGERPGTDLLTFVNGPPQRRDLFVGVIVPDGGPEERRDHYIGSIGVATSAEQMDRAVLVGWTRQPISEPYAVIALYDADST